MEKKGFLLSLLQMLIVVKKRIFLRFKIIIFITTATLVFFCMSSFDKESNLTAEDVEDGDETESESEFYGEACPYLDYYKIWPLYIKKYGEKDKSENSDIPIGIKDLLELK